MFSPEDLAKAKRLSCENYEKKETDIGFEFQGQWITNPFMDVTGRIELTVLDDMHKMYGQENVNSFLIDILRESKYPVSKEKCSSCGMCSLVTKTITGVPLKEHEQYYQCLAMAEEVCED